MPHSYCRTFSTLGCVELDLDEVFELAVRHGIGAVELRGLGGSINVPAWLAQTYGSPERLASKINQHSVYIAGLSTSLRLIGNTEDDRNAFLEFIPWAEALGISRLRVFDGGAQTSSDEQFKQALDTLAWWNTLRRENGWRVDIMIETHGALISTPAILRFMSAAPSGTALLWDAHNTWRHGESHPVTTWAAIKEFVVHIHVKDSVSSPATSHPYTYVIPGRGEFPMNALKDSLSQDGYTGPVSLEWERHWHPSLAPLSDALSAAATHWW